MTIACPACAASPLPEPSLTALEPTHVLHLPDIHCALCITSVEGTLSALPQVQAARVNLTRKRVFVTAPGASTQALIAALAEAGHRAERLDTGRLGPEDTTRRDLLTRIGVAGFGMMNVMLLSVAVWSGAAGVTAQLFHLISAAITIPAVTYAAQPFFVSAWSALSVRRLNMDVPISLAIILACAASLGAAFGFSDRAGWFDAALALTFFLLVGRYLDLAGRTAARSAAADLAALEAPQAVRLDGEHETVVAAEALAPGDLIRVRPGDRLPADGTIVSGRSDMDRSALTGESFPEAAGIGDTVTSGETCLTGVLTVRVDRAGRDTALSRMAELVATAESQRTRYAGIADRAAQVYAPLVHVLGAATFLVWLAVTGDFWRSLDVGISVLVITCPCALGLAVPVVSTVATTRLFRAGILVKSDTALERLSEIDMVAFDKTGTLTTGVPDLAEAPDDRALAIAAGLAQASNHPLSRAILTAAEARGIAPAPVTDTAEHPGRGVEGLLDNRRVRLGREGWAGGATGDASAWLAIEGEAPIPFRTRETLRPEAKGVIDALHRAGYATALLSGDGAQPVAEIAARAGIDLAEARLSPEDKVAWLDRRAAEGRRVLMVGDGLNDTGGLASAHAAMSPGSALDAARSAADVILLSGGLDGVPQTLATARTAMVRMRQNIALSALYNVVSVPLAMAGFATPFAAAIAMSVSSITVTLNAVRRFR